MGDIPLPEPEIESKQIDSVMRVYTIRSHSVDQVRAIQREAMRVAIEAAAKVCRDFDATDSLSNYGLVLARMIEELEIGT